MTGLLKMVVVVCVGAACVCAPVAAADDSPPIKVTAVQVAAIKVTAKQRDDDRVAVRTEQDRTTVTVDSPRGISSATLERTGKAWPKTVVLRLNLNGLENLRITAGEVTLEGSVSLPEGKPLLRLWDGKEVAPGDPFWMDVQVLDKNGKPAEAIPLHGGCFVLTLPPALLKDNPQSITVRWIDFYRN
jgi:hypothetical protein